MSNGVTIVNGPTGDGMLPSAGGNAGQQTGACPAGWFTCTSSDGGGCCPTGYNCQMNNCVTTATGLGPTGTATVAKVSTSGGSENGGGMLLVFTLGINLAYGIFWI